jgi:hypothetical protein
MNDSPDNTASLGTAPPGTTPPGTASDGITPEGTTRGTVGTGFVGTGTAVGMGTAVATGTLVRTGAVVGGGRVVATGDAVGAGPGTPGVIVRARVAAQAGGARGRVGTAAVRSSHATLPRWRGIRTPPPYGRKALKRSNRTFRD